MGESESHGRLINPCFFHLQKLELELKCPACLNLLRHPVLLPCDHMFCSACITDSTGCGLFCPICKLSLIAQDLRAASHIETIIKIFKSMNTAFSGNFCPPRSQVDQPETNKSAAKHQVACNKNSVGKLQGNKVQSTSRQKTSTITMEAFAEQGGPCSSPSQGGPYSSPSSGGLKFSDDDSNDGGSALSDKRMLACASYKTDIPVSKTKLAEQIAEDASRTIFQVEDQGREVKRQKFNNSFRNETTDSGRDDKMNDIGFQHASKNTSQCSQSGHEGPTYFLPSSMANEGASSVGFRCGFCHSSEESMATGQMGHYADGEPVDGDEAKRPNVLHAHQKCIEWAPKAYFDGDTVVDLEAELSRASKIKCSHCGKKGAALGCYVKSCRKSFHVPCAVEIEECRWDCDNFLILCPTHSSRKLRCDRSRTEKNVRNISPACHKVGHKSPDNDEKLWLAPPEATQGWVLCGSALSLAEKDLVAELARLTGAVVTKDWRPDVTHVIASTDPQGACSRTLKFLMAILNGKWVLNVKWIKACLDAKRPVSEDNYEISHDIHGCPDGPKNGRTRLMKQAPQLFSGLSFCFSGDFVPTYKGYLEELISAAGGNVLPENTDGSSSTAVLVVYNLDPPPEQGDNKGVVDKRLLQAYAVAARIGAQVIGHTWVLDSIAGCKILPLFP